MTRRDLLATAMAAALPRPSRKTIFIEMSGGPSHTDLFDLQLGEWTPSWMKPVSHGSILFPAGLMPRLADLLDRFTLVRGLEARSLEHHSVVPELDGPMLRATSATFLDACRHALLSPEQFLQIRFGSWDHHGNLYGLLRPMAQSFDEGVATLIRGARDTHIVAMGEFGRTPGPLNQNGGRDHHPIHAAFVAQVI